MRKAICVAIIEDRGILLVKKHETWILPGGKPKERESDIRCLIREFNEELPRTMLENITHYKDFIGTTPHKGDTLKARVYFADIKSGPFMPSEEISAYTWVKDTNNYNLSDITSKIIEDLKLYRHL